MNTLSITWENQTPINVTLNDTPPADHMFKNFKHLQYVELEFKTNLRDNPFSLYRTDQELAYAKIIEFGKNVGVSVEYDKLNDQDYLNYLHKLYEVNYTNEREWLMFHEFIHIVERLPIHRNISPSEIAFDYREKGGMLVTNYKRSFDKYLTDELKRGTCYIRWQELGKHPYEYFDNSEPDNLERICQLAKPWLLLKPNMFIAYYDYNTTTKHIGSNGYSEFKKWFKQYEDAWKEKWNVPNWEPESMFKVLPIGTIGSSDMDILEERLQDNVYPNYVKCK